MFIYNKLHCMLVILTTCLMVSGCVTNNTFNKNQCLQGNWQAIGYQDGLNGRSEQYIYQHIKTCGNYQIMPNKLQWEKGRQAGLKQYCTPLRAYQLGREGYNFHNVCPADMMLDLLKAHDEGYYYYQRNQDLIYFDDYPWGWGWLFGYPYYRDYTRNPYPRYVYTDKKPSEPPKKQTENQPSTSHQDAPIPEKTKEPIKKPTTPMKPTL